jgi:hypothetical protein
MPTDSPTRSRVACRVARWWVRAYTASLSTDARDGRRAEIESDLWEHLADADANQQHRINTEIDVLARVLIGIPADVTWFRRVRRTTKETSSMQHTPASTARAVSPVLAVAIAAALTVLVALILVRFSAFLLIPIALLVFFGARAVRARRPSLPQVAPTPEPSNRARHHRLLAVAIVSAVVIVCDIVVLNFIGELDGEWAWTLLVPVGFLVPFLVGATAGVLLFADWITARADG